MTVSDYHSVVITVLCGQFRNRRSYATRLVIYWGSWVSVFLLSALAFGSPAKSLDEIQAVIRAGDLTRARTELSEFLNLSPNNPSAWNMLGVVKAQQGDYHGAEASFQKAINLAPGFSGAYLNLGRLYQENVTRDPEALRKGILAYERLLKFEPGNPEANYQSAFLLLKAGSFQASLDHLSRLSAEQQSRSQALAVRCGDYGGLRRPSEAAAAADRLLQSPELQEADVTSILPMLTARHLDGLALQLLNGLAARRLASPPTLFQLAAIDQATGHFEQARATLETVAQMQHSVSVPLLLDLAHVAYRQGDRQGTLGYLAHARELDPNNAAVHFFFGMVCVEMNLTEEAFRSLQKATQLNPNNPYYNYAFGAVIMSREEVRDAYPYFQKYCEEKPNDPRGRLALGSAYFYGHDLDGARKELQSVLAYPQTGATAHYFLGRIANDEGDYRGAKRELLAALRLRPDYADAYAEIGLLNLKQKEYPEAGEALRKALEIAPDNYVANLNLMILYERTKDPRAPTQTKRFQEISKLRQERQKEFLRTIEIRP